MIERVYVPAVFDLFHYGHVRMLKKLKEIGNFFIVVGLHSDEDSCSFKRKPIMTMEERKEVLESCIYIDEVVLNAPIITTDEVLDKYKCKYAAGYICKCGNKIHDSQFTNVLNRFIELPYTKEISTTEIIRRCKIENK